MDDGDGQLDLELLAGGRQGKRKLGLGREVPWIDILERAGYLYIQEVSDAKEPPWPILLDLLSTSR